jgi:hypothetical protein
MQSVVRMRNIELELDFFSLAYAIAKNQLILQQTITDQCTQICTQVARLCSPIQYPKPDGVLSFDVPTSLHRFKTVNMFSILLFMNLLISNL